MNDLESIAENSPLIRREPGVQVANAGRALVGFRANGSQLRSGVVAVELAICSSLLFLFFFAALEFSRANMLRQSAENAVYEGARRGIVSGASASDVQARAQVMLDMIGTNNATVTVAPSPLTDTDPQITVSVSIPFDDNAWFVPSFLSGSNIQSSLTLNRERFASGL